ncbi:hypothetical protein F2Q69_00052819 [Brassica cretica]|uniref:Uncharacterized protein n=1 Tax=Brassica cretica TaxID=69181 RepID=A0A8S9N126_BRACR|nr:hypothetical protein F2Q69_00052819 [Brassica cretica]
MPNQKEKELLELDGKNLQIRQVGVNGDPPDPMLAGAWLLGPNAAKTQGFLAHQESYPSPRNSHYKLRYRFSSKGNRTRHV